MVGHQVVIPHKHLTICVCAKSGGSNCTRTRAFADLPCESPKDGGGTHPKWYLDVHPIWLLITDHPILVIRKKVGEFQEGITSIQKTTK